VARPEDRRNEIDYSSELSVTPSFTERPTWHAVGNGWRHLYGSVTGTGLSFEWHDFTLRKEFNWGKTFHPGSIEVCLNREGNGRVAINNCEATFAPLKPNCFSSLPTRSYFARGSSGFPPNGSKK
jgi:hypothetical protein